MLTLLSRRSLSHQGHSSLHMPRITHFIMPRYFTPGFRPHGMLRIYMLFNAFIMHIYATQLLITHLYRIYMHSHSFVPLGHPVHAYINQSSSGYPSLHTYFAFHYAPCRISLCSHSHFIMLQFAFRYAPIRISLCFET